MKTKNYVLIGLLLVILTSFGYTSKSKNDPILTRHDKDETEFFKLAERFEKYICHLNLPDCEATVIKDQWALTAAHCAVTIVNKFKSGKKHFVIINNVEIEVDKVIMHPSWTAGQNADENDIALIHLKTKPIGALQAKLYTDTDEVDKLIYMVGKGDIGNGLIGVNGNDGKQRGATNRVETATENWLTWTFDHPNTKTKYLTEHEGISGPGDSGGPAFILKNDIVYLAGISSGQDQKGGDEGLYGVEEYYTRVSQYIKWIHEEMTGNGDVAYAKYRVEPKPNAIDTRPKAIYVNPNTLKKYVGEYIVQGITIKNYLNKENSKLYSSVDNQMPYELVPIAKNVFSFKRLEGFKLEYKNEQNGIFKHLIVTQPDGTYKATRK